MIQYITYWGRMIRCAVTGSRTYYIWMATLLAFISLAGVFWVHDLTHGLGGTNMNDHVSWGIGIANFVYFVGVADGAAVLVVPAYAFRRGDIKEIVLLGVLLAVVAVTACLLFIIVDLGRPERMWHLFPVLGFLNVPDSLLAWDVVVVGGYLAMNLHIPGYLLYRRYLGKPPTAAAYMPFVFLSMIWAVVMHTVTAFLLSGPGARPFWSTAILAPRFLISALASAPALLIFVFTAMQKWGGLKVKQSVFDYFWVVLRVCMPINLFLLSCELFQEFYAGSLHSASARYLYFGIHDSGMLSVFIWTAIAFNVTATTIFLVPRLFKVRSLMFIGCGLAVVGIWIEKGMGLIFPGFIPSPLGEVVEYAPNVSEIIVSVGILALGMFVYTAMAKITIAIQKGELRLHPVSPEDAAAEENAAMPKVAPAEP